MPLVIYTVSGPWSVVFRANVILYTVLAACTLLALPELLFPPASPAEAAPDS